MYPSSQTNTWEERIARGTEAEKIVAQQLRDQKWNLESLGQSQMSPALRAALRDQKEINLLRWFPDLAAWRISPLTNRTIIFAIDAKSIMKTQVNLSVEERALEASEEFERSSRMPWLFVIPGLMCFDPITLRTGSRSGGPGGGSGTPYVVMPKIQGYH